MVKLSPIAVGIRPSMILRARCTRCISSPPAMNARNCCSCWSANAARRLAWYASTMSKYWNIGPNHGSTEDADGIAHASSDGEEPLAGTRTGAIGADWQYLYEPNASIMKAGCFAVIKQRFDVHPIGPNSHLFVSAKPVDGFPGRSFAIESIATMNKKELKQALAGLTHANIAVRNFFLSVAQLQKLKLSGRWPPICLPPRMRKAGTSSYAPRNNKWLPLTRKPAQYVRPRSPWRWSAPVEGTNQSWRWSCRRSDGSQVLISVTSRTGITAGFLVPFSSATLTCSL